ncbi:MAG TPA: archease [Gemmatimonadales bacterium]|nr:archease [Gemmatimonadales bacterium]
MGTSSELLEHTAEVRLRVRAPSFGELAAEAGRAVARLELGREPPPAEAASRDLEIRAPDREALLVDWLNELVFLAETERWVATEFEVLAPADTVLRLRAWGVHVDEAPARIKAATFHGLKVAAVPGGLEAEVVFDV